MTYNKSEIMKAAWKAYKIAKNYEYRTKETTFSECLRTEWKLAKAKIERERIRVKYINEVILPLIANVQNTSEAEEIIYDSFRRFRNHNDVVSQIGPRVSNDLSKARMQAWKTVKSFFSCGNGSMSFDTVLFS